MSKILLWIAMLGAIAQGLSVHAASADAAPGVLRAEADGLVWQLPGEATRIRFVGGQSGGYDVCFELLADGKWQEGARFPEGQVWNVYSDWRESWYADLHPVKVQNVELLADGRVRATASADVAGQRWWFADVFSIEHGMVRIDRSFVHPGQDAQSKITLETRIRLPLGDEQRMLMPGVLYNNNPSSTLVGTKIETTPGGLGLYEEHRLPIPMVNIESQVGGVRQYGSLVAKPSKILQGNKVGDHWWSLGLDYGKDSVDLLSVSGPVATNGRKSWLYGHRNGFDPYDDAYLNVKGPVAFEKKLYLDLGTGIKTGYAFRETLWKAFEVFQPTETPHVPFPEALALLTEYAKTRYFLEEARGGAPAVSGYTYLPGQQYLMYGWVGGNLAIAYGVLCHAERSGDEASRQQAIASTQFFVRNSQAGVEGLYYTDFQGKWVKSIHQRPLGISSRQYGENLFHLAQLVEQGLRMKLPETDEWLAALKKAGDFLIRSPRYQGLFPRAWTPMGEGVGWPANGAPPRGSISSAGVFCIVPLARLFTLTGDVRYRQAAEQAMDAYWREYGDTLATPPWGATLDAGSEDKEATWGMMLAALEVYAATKEPRFLKMAKDAADLTITWIYFHNVGLNFVPHGPLLSKHMNTVGWSFISTQNQEIDLWGYYMAPDFYRLGQLTGDEGYKKIGRVLFDACTQTISRPGAMFFDVPGLQTEHYNQSNCTYVTGQPWRGGFQPTPGISWLTAAALFGGNRLVQLDPEKFLVDPIHKTFIPPVPAAEKGY